MELFDLARYGVLPKNKKILLFEAFSGIGTQAMAFERLKELIGIDYEVVGFSEIDKYAIMSYHAIHGEHLKNYGDISKIEQLPKCDVCTWSFPCQDISLAGHQKGMVEGTRSNYGFDFIETVRRSEHKPKILIMENVKALVSERFQDDFKEIKERLKSMGYENHWKVLNAKHYGVAQNRERVFMISILGGGYFQFPPKVKLTKRLKDYLEDEVDEKYYIDDYKFFKMINENYGELNGGKWENVHDITKRVYTDDNVSPTIHTMQGGNLQPKIIIDDTAQTICLNSKVNGKQPSLQDCIYDTDGVSTSITTSFMPSIQASEPKIMVVGNLDTKHEQSGRVHGVNGISPTIMSNSHGKTDGGYTPLKISIPEATKQGYVEAHDGDGVYINRPHQKRGVVQKQMIQTIKTSSDDIGVVVEGVLDGNNFNQNKNIYNQRGLSPTLSGLSRCGNEPKVINGLRIRKLTPRECWRLMDISDDDYDKASKVCSNSQLYKQAGNAIVVNVLVQIFKNLIE